MYILYTILCYACPFIPERPNCPAGHDMQTEAPAAKAHFQEHLKS